MSEQNNGLTPKDIFWSKGRKVQWRHQNDLLSDS